MIHTVGKYKTFRIQFLDALITLPHHEKWANIVDVDFMYVMLSRVLSLEFRQRCWVQSRARFWLQLVGCAALLMDASNFGGPDRVGESGVEPRRSLRQMRAS